MATISNQGAHIYARYANSFADRLSNSSFSEQAKKVKEINASIDSSSEVNERDKRIMDEIATVVKHCEQ